MQNCHPESAPATLDEQMAKDTSNIPSPSVPEGKWGAPASLPATLRGRSPPAPRVKPRPEDSSPQSTLAGPLQQLEASHWEALVTKDIAGDPAWAQQPPNRRPHY